MHTLLEPKPGLALLAPGAWKLILGVVAVLLAYWTLETAEHVMIHQGQEGRLLDQIFPAGLELWNRLSVTLALLALGGYALHLMSRHRLMRQALEQALLQNELILNAAGEGIYGLDPAGNVTFVNAAAARSSGYERGELLGQHIHEMMHYRKADGTPHPPEECPIYATLKDGEARRVTDDVFWTRKGASFPVEYVSTPMRQNGQVTGVVVVFRDISDQKQAREELQKAKDFLENIFENSADAVGLVDEHSRFVKWNKAAEEAYGYSFAELQGRSAFDLYADQDQLEQMLAQLRRDGLVRRYEIDMKKKDGSIVPFALSINYLRDQDQKIVGSITVARDRTAIRQALADLKVLNDQLRGEICEREKTEEALQEANNRLQGLIRELEQRHQEISLLNELGDLLQACLDREEAYAAIAQVGARLFPDESGTLFVRNAAVNLLEPAALWGEASPGEQVFPPQDCWAFRRGECIRFKVPLPVCSAGTCRPPPWPTTCASP